ncbi:MAG: TetR/AcrR family transcriptional regulator [Bacilli bacterium]
MKTNDLIKVTFLKEIISKGIDSVNVQSLCSVLNVKRQTFYYYYRDMYDLVDSILGDYYDDFKNKEINIYYISEVLEFIKENVNLFTEFINSSLHELFESFLKKLILPYTAYRIQEIKSCDLLSNDNIREITEFLSRGIIYLLTEVITKETDLQTSLIRNKINLYLDPVFLTDLINLYHTNRRNI